MSTTFLAGEHHSEDATTVSLRPGEQDIHIFAPEGAPTTAGPWQPLPPAFRFYTTLSFNSGYYADSVRTHEVESAAILVGEEYEFRAFYLGAESVHDITPGIATASALGGGVVTLSLTVPTGTVGVRFIDTWEIWGAPVGDPKVLIARFDADGSEYFGPTTGLPDVLSASEDTEWYGASNYVDGHHLGSLDPDVIAAASPSATADEGFFDWYPAATMDTYDFGAASNYYTVGVVTYAESAFAGLTVPMTPNGGAPEFGDAASGSITWQIRGVWSAGTGDLTDPMALQLENCVAHIALAPAELLMETGSGEENHPQLMFIDWPTKATLDGLAKVLSVPAPELADYPSFAWSSNYNRANLDFEIDLPIDPAWVVDGQCSFVLWLERTDSTDRFFDNSYTVPRTPIFSSSWHLEPAGPTYPAGAGEPYTLGLDSTGNQRGIWYSDGAGGVYLNSKDGAAVGGIYLYNGRNASNEIAGPRTWEWEWKQVTTSDFGMAVLIQPWGSVCVVTPTQVVTKVGSGAPTVLATHSTPFATGDICEVEFVGGSGSTVSVRRNGVEVSTFVHPGYGSSYAGPWAIEVNTGNVMGPWTISGEPTTDFGTYLYFEPDYHDTEVSRFVAPSPTEYRWNYPIGYPVFQLEKWDHPDDNEEWVAWIRLSSTDALWGFYGWYNPLYGTLDPEDFPDSMCPSIQMVQVRPDGQMFTREIVNDDLDVREFWPWGRLRNGMIRMSGTDAELGDWYDTPEGHIDFGPIADWPTYLRFGLEVGTSDPSDDWRQYLNAYMHLELYDASHRNRPKYWTWQEGDDHDGFQDIGYAHDTQEMPTGVSAGMRGMAIQVMDQIEGWTYSGRDGIVGVGEDGLPFFYGWFSPGNGFRGIFDDEELLMYSSNDAHDDEGAHFLNQGYGFPWWAELADPDENWGTVTGASFSDNPGRLARIPSPATRPVDLTAGQEDWGSYDPLFVVYLYAYPDSLFVLDERRYEVNTVLRMREVNKRTGAVIREMDPFQRPDWDFKNDYYHRWWYPVPSADGERICLVFPEDSARYYHHLIPAYLTTIDNPYSPTPGPISTTTVGGPFVYSEANNPEALPITNATFFTPAKYYSQPTIGRPVVAGDFAFASSIFGLNTYFAGYTLKYGGRILTPDSKAVQVGIRFYDEDQELISETWSGSFATTPAQSDVLDTVVVPAGAVFAQTMVRNEPGNGGTEIRVNLWLLHETVYSNVTHDATPHSTVTNYSRIYWEYDVATETIGAPIVVPGSVDHELMGRGPNGYLLEGYTSGNPVLWNPFTNHVIPIDYESYEGHGFNGGQIGTDGRYVYFHQLNHHVEPSAYILTADDIAQVPPGIYNPYSVGDVVSIGGGIAVAFNEFYRYDLELAGSTPGAPWSLQFSNPDGASGTTGWVVTPGQEHPVSLSSTGTALQAAVTGTVLEGDTYSIRTTLALNDSDSLLRVRCIMGAYVGGCYGRIKVEQYTSGWGTLLQTDEGAAQQYLITSGGFTEEVQLDFTKHPSSDQAWVTFTWQMASPSAVNPYGRVYDVELQSMLGALPIEYLFNLDPPETHANSYGAAGVVEPNTSFYRTNLLTVNQWAPSDLTGFNAGPVTALTVPETGVLRAVFGASDRYFTLTPATLELPLSYLTGGYRVRSPLGTSELLTISLELLNASDVVVATTTKTQTVSSTGWVDMAGNGDYLAAHSTATKVRLKVSCSTDGTLEFTNFDVQYPFPITYHSPALNGQEYLSGWLDNGSGSIVYWFSWWGGEGSFVPRTGKWSVGRIEWGITEDTDGVPPELSWTDWEDTADYTGTPVAVPGSNEWLNQATTNVTDASPTFYSRNAPVSSTLSAGWAGASFYPHEDPPMFHGWVNGVIYTGSINLSTLSSSLPPMAAMIEWPDGAVAVEFEDDSYTGEGLRLSIRRDYPESTDQVNDWAGEHSYGDYSLRERIPQGTFDIDRHWYVRDALPTLPAAGQETVPRDGGVPGEYRRHTHWMPWRDALVSATPDVVMPPSYTGTTHVDLDWPESPVLYLATCFDGGLDYETPLLGMPDWVADSPKCLDTPPSLVRHVEENIDGTLYGVSGLPEWNVQVAARVGLPRHRFLMKE